MKKVIYSVAVMLLLVVVSCGSNKNTVEEKGKNMSQNDIDVMPKSGPAPEIKFEKPQVFEMDNGMKLIVVENHKLPSVTATLKIDNPPVSLGNKIGSDDLLSSLLGTGSKTVSKDEFNEKTDFYGANVYLYNAGFRINSLSRFFGDVLKLTVDQVVNPKFTKEEFIKQKDLAVEGLKTQEKSTPAAANRVRRKLAYGAHPYGEIAKISDLEKLSLEDVNAYYQNNFTPNHAYLIVVGDVKTDELKTLVKEGFKGWEKTSELMGAPIPTIKNVRQTEIDFVNMPNAEQTEIKVVHRSDIRIAKHDYPKVLLMNSILGGDFNSYLNMTLREKHGWTYGARSHFGTDKYGALFEASTSVRNSVADSAVVATMEQINKIINEKVDPKVLKNTKAKYVGNFVLSMEKPSTIAGQALKIYTNNLSEDFYKTFLEKIEAVTVDDIQTMAKKYLHPSQARIIVAGKAADIVPGLEKKGFKINYFDKYGNPVKKPEMNKAIPTGINLKYVLDNYFKAIGVKDEINDVKTLIQKYEASMQGAKLEILKKSMYPNKTFQQTSFNGMVVSTIVFDGTNGRKEQQGMKKPLDEKELAKMKKQTAPFEEVALYKTGKLKRLETVETVDYYVLTDGESDYYFNSKTGLLDKTIKKQEMNGQTISQNIEFADYKVVNGIKFPHTIIVPMGPQKLKLELKETKINADVSEKDFK